MSRLLLIISIFILTACGHTRAKVDYPNPSENYIDIEGQIADNLTYKIMVEYTTRSESNACKNYELFAGFYVSQTAKFEYQPTINNGRHKARIPLMELDPSTECSWEPRTVYLCIASTGSDDHSCGSLFFLSENHEETKEINLECNVICFSELRGVHTYQINTLNRSYSVNIKEKKWKN